MSDRWAEAHSELLNALERAKEAGVLEEEAMSAVDDIYHEDPAAYEPGRPKVKK